MAIPHIEAPFAIEFPLPFRVVVLGGLGILCWATNLHGLSLLGIDVASALDLRPQDPGGGLISPRLATVSSRARSDDAPALARGVYRVFFAYALATLTTWVLYRACSRDEEDLVDSCSFIPAVGMLLIVMGMVLPIATLEKHLRDQFLRALQRCIFSPLSSPVYFSDVILADVLTSFAKVIGDIWLSLCMFWPGGSLLIFPSQDGWTGMMVPCLMSVPYLIRFRQCVVEYLQPTNNSKRPLYNALKYASSFPVIFLSAAQRTVANDISLEKGTFEAGEHPLFKLWLLSVAVNSLYSFWWDVTNDWGLELLRSKPRVDIRRAPRQLILPTLHAQENREDDSPHLHSRHPSRKDIPNGDHNGFSTYLNQADYPWGLRPTLLLPRQTYPIVILLNLVLRLTWSAKLSSHLHHSNPSTSLGGADSESGFYVPGAAVIFYIEVAELFRRWIWVFFRVEWECVKKRDQEREFAPEVGDLELDGLGLSGVPPPPSIQVSGEVVFDMKPTEP